MKKVLLIAMAFGVLMCGTALAQGSSHGSAIVPMVITYSYDTYNYTTSQLYLSNITSEEVQCTVRFYDHDGNDIGALADVYKGHQTAGIGVKIATDTSSFSIPANGTRYLDFYESTTRNQVGYAIVEWESTNVKISKALVGGHRTYGRAGTGTIFNSSTLINNGQPF